MVREFHRVESRKKNQSIEQLSIYSEPIRHPKLAGGFKHLAISPMCGMIIPIG